MAAQLFRMVYQIVHNFYESIQFLLVFLKKGRNTEQAGKEKNSLLKKMPTSTIVDVFDWIYFVEFIFVMVR